MKCPHCMTGIHRNLGAISNFFVYSRSAPNPGSVGLPIELRENVAWSVFFQQCPECNGAIIYLGEIINNNASKTFMAHPVGSSRPIAPEVPEPYRQDFAEACNVLASSAKASAALSRRSLQAMLRDKFGTKSKDLYDQIEEAIKSGTLPSHITDGLHAVRNIGNFAAHPLKSTSTGLIVEVELGEAEWNLDVVDMLFDFYFVQPAIAAKRKTELNKKLKDANKPELA